MAFMMNCAITIDIQAESLHTTSGQGPHDLRIAGGRRPHTQCSQTTPSLDQTNNN